MSASSGYGEPVWAVVRRTVRLIQHHIWTSSLKAGRGRSRNRSLPGTSSQDGRFCDVPDGVVAVADKEAKQPFGAALGLTATAFDVGASTSPTPLAPSRRTSTSWSATLAEARRTAPMPQSETSLTPQSAQPTTTTAATAGQAPTAATRYSEMSTPTRSSC